MSHTIKLNSLMNTGNYTSTQINTEMHMLNDINQTMVYIRSCVIRELKSWCQINCATSLGQHMSRLWVLCNLCMCVCGEVDEIHERTFTALVDSLICGTLTHRFVLSLSLLQIYPPLCLPLPLHLCICCACLPNQYSSLGLKQPCIPACKI